MLASREFGESGRLVTLLTRERGKLRAVAKGVRRPRSSLAAGVLPFARSTLLLWRGRNLDGISQAQVLESLRPLREDVERLAHAACLCELVEALAREDDPAPELYELLLDGLRLLARAEPSRLSVILFAAQWQALALAGFRPELDACVACGAALGPGETGFAPAAGGAVCGGCPAKAALVLSAPARAALRFLGGRPLAAAARLSLAPGDVRAVAAATGAFAEAVLERPLKSRPFLEILREVPRAAAGPAVPEGGGADGHHAGEG